MVVASTAVTSPPATGVGTTMAVIAYVPSALRVWLKRISSPTLRASTATGLTALGDDRRARHGDRAGPAVLGAERQCRSVDGPDRDRASARSAVALAPLPLSSLLALSGFWPWPLPCGLALGSADGEAPATSASGVSDGDGRWAITMMTDRQRKADGDHERDQEAVIPPLCASNPAAGCSSAGPVPGSRIDLWIGQRGAAPCVLASP